MILDEYVEFAAETAVATATGTSNFGDTIDLSAGVPIQTVTRIGEDASKQLHIHVTVTEAFTSAGAATVQFQAITDAQDPPLTDGSATFHVSSAEIPVADLTVGTQLFLTLPMKEGERYLGLQTVVGTAALTAGAITSGIMLDPKGWYAYKDAQN